MAKSGGNTYGSPARTCSETMGPGPVQGAGQASAGGPGPAAKRVKPDFSAKGKGGNRRESTDY